MPLWVPVESYELATGEESFGTIIRVSDGDSPETFHAIAGVGDIDGPNETVNVVEVRTHSTGNPYPNARPGVFGLTSLSFPVYFDPANPSHSYTSDFGLGYMLKNRVRRTWQIIYPDDANTTYEFSGFVSELGNSSPVDGINERSCTLTIDGGITEITTPTP
jgi:hypothetical protein